MIFMDKHLLKFYIFFIAAFFLLINIFPNLFININNSINYVKEKIIIAFEKNKDTVISIDKRKGNIIIMLDDG
jgi:hypothetical protein